MREQRLNSILNFINARGFCTNEAISDKLNIPLTTLRRDLDALDQKHLIERVYGGAKAINPKMVGDVDFAVKMESNAENKILIAKKALSCIKKGETIYLDGGSTTYQLAKMIPVEYKNKIYTNSVDNALVLASYGHTDVHLIPGRLKNVTHSIVGVEAVEAISEYHFDVSFIGVNAVDDDYNYYTTDEEEAAIKKAAIKSSELPFALADKSKFHQVSFARFSSKNELPVISEEE